MKIKLIFTASNRSNNFCKAQKEKIKVHFTSHIFKRKSNSIIDKKSDEPKEY